MHGKHLAQGWYLQVLYKCRFFYSSFLLFLDASSHESKTITAREA